MVTPRIYLASSSPRRCALLDQIGASYQVLDVNVSEQLNANEVPEMYVLRLALEKARAGELLLFPYDIFHARTKKGLLFMYIQ